MKNLLSVTLAFIFSITTSFAQRETAKPTHDVTVEREIAYATIEKKEYKNVTITLKAAPLSGNVFTDGIKVIVTDNATGKKIYQKRFSKSYLYAFSDGQLQVGKGNALTQIIISKSKYGDYWNLELREKGIY